MDNIVKFRRQSPRPQNTTGRVNHQKAQDLHVISIYARGSRQQQNNINGQENRKTPKQPTNSYWKARLANLRTAT